MKEIWDHPFGHALLKIERADVHISEINERLRVSPDSYGPSLHVDSKTGKQFLYYGLTDSRLRSDIALIVGDAIHNLHCALDIAYSAAVRVLSLGGFDYSRTKFPLANDRKHLESLLTKTAKIDPSSPLFQLLVERIKPYKGGDVDICAIHTFDIDDKHHLLIPMLTATAIEGVKLQNEDGSIDCYDIVLTRPNFYREVVPFGANFKDHGEVRFKVTFGQGTPFQDLEVVPILNRFSRKTKAIVRTLQRMTPPCHGSTKDTTV